MLVYKELTPQEIYFYSSLSYYIHQNFILT